MSLAQRFERRLEGLVGGAFARVFKGQVEPVEIGNALQREAADKRNVMGAAQVLSPNRYRVTLALVGLRAIDAVGSTADELPGRAGAGVPGREPLGNHRRHRGLPGPGRRAAHRCLRRRVPDGVPGAPAPPPARFAVAAGRPRLECRELRRRHQPRPSQRRPGRTSPPPSSPYGGGGPGRRTRTAARSHRPAPPAPSRQNPGACVVVDQTNQRFDLRVGSNIVGRGTDADLQLLDQGISRRHLDIQFDGNAATAYDLGSTNGTTVNGHEVGSQVLAARRRDSGRPHPAGVPSRARVTTGMIEA